MNINRYYFIILFTSSSLFSYSQIPDSSLKVPPQFPKKYYSKVDKKIGSVNDQLTKKSLKYLAKFQRQERKLQQKVEQLYPDSDLSVFTGLNERYKKFSQNIKNREPNPAKTINGEYSPYLDSLGSSLSFLKQFNGISDKVKEPLASLNQLQNKLQQSEKIKEFIAERKNQIKELLSKYTKIPGGFKKEFDKLNKTAYYYSAQVKEYKDMLKDPKRIEQKALNILNTLPAFKRFIKQNGQLASLFRINENLDPVQSLAGLQTSSSVQTIIQQRVAGGGPNAMQILQQNIAQATGELDKLKDKVNQLGGGSSDIEMPDFKPNDQKTKTFLKRLEYSADVQFDKSNKLLPSATNIGLGIGYKLNDKSTAGIGMSYKIGVGPIRHISFTSQAVGLRSYMDWKIKKQIYATAGYEMNYNAAFKNIEQLKNYNAWQRSALIGISKRYKINKKVQGEMKLLYDFLANQHIPVTQAFLFRVGYTFK